MRRATPLSRLADSFGQLELAYFYNSCPFALISSFKDV